MRIIATLCDAQSMLQDRLIGSTEAAQILGVHKATVLRWAEAGKLTARQLDGENGAYVYSAHEVERVAAELGRGDSGSAA